MFNRIAACHCIDSKCVIEIQLISDPGHITEYKYKLGFMSWARLHFICTRLKSQKNIFTLGFSDGVKCRHISSQTINSSNKSSLHSFYLHILTNDLKDNNQNIEGVGGVTITITLSS